MNEMIVKVKKLHEDAILPTKAHFTDAGFDLYALEDVLLLNNRVTKVKTGISISIPGDYVGLVWEKSGLACQGVEVHGGVIDCGYTGEILVCMRRSLESNNMYGGIYSTSCKIDKGQKIAQLLIQEIPLHVSFEEVDELEDTERGEGGFGSTGR